LDNKTASIRARLKTWARAQGIPFQYASMLYMHEGILGRISRSPYTENLVLKGGLLLFIREGTAGRTTRDIDFLGRNFPADEKAIKDLFDHILTIELNDGLIFNPESISTEQIMEEADYHGIKVSIECYLGVLRNQLHIDLGFGDALPHGPEKLAIARIVDGSIIQVMAYPFPSVVAEKFEAMIARGELNSRMKDIFDVAFLLSHYEMTEGELQAAMLATFRNRQTRLPERPIAFTRSYLESERNLQLWEGFLRRTNLSPVELTKALETIKNRLEPIYHAVRKAMI